MDTNKILSSDLLDLVFNDRNKMYGAYELRRHYPQRVMKSLLLTAIISSLVFAGSLLANSLQPPKEKSKGIIVTPMDILTPVEEKKPEQPAAPKKKPEQPRPRTEALVSPVITEVVDKPMPTQEDVSKAQIGLEHIEGQEDTGDAPPPDNVTDGKGLIDKKPVDDEPLGSVDVPACYDGNWEKFLLKYLDGNVPLDNGAATGRYRVVIQFVVDKDGSVSDLKPLTNAGYGMEQEAMRVLKKADKWKPGLQHGFPVKAYHRQVIIFDVSTE